MAISEKQVNFLTSQTTSNGGFFKDEFLAPVADPPRSFFEKRVEPLLNKFKSTEKIHKRVYMAADMLEKMPYGLRAVKQLAYRGERHYDSRLALKHLETTLADNILGLAPGMSKNGQALEFMKELGYGWTAVGSVLLWKHPGNDLKHRMGSDAPGISWNNIGLESWGVHGVIPMLERYRGRFPFSISIAKSSKISVEQAPEVYGAVAREINRAGLRPIMEEVNISCLNSHGLSKVQDDLGLVYETVKAVEEHAPHGCRVVLKPSPDIGRKNFEGLIRVCDDLNAGLVIANASREEFVLKKYGGQEEWDKRHGGSLAGADPDYQAMVLAWVAFARTLAPEMFIGMVGGIDSPRQAIRGLHAGANFIEVGTASRTVGPTLPGKILRGISKYMDDTGLKLHEFSDYWHRGHYMQKLNKLGWK